MEDVKQEKVNSEETDFEETEIEHENIEQEEEISEEIPEENPTDEKQILKDQLLRLQADFENFRNRKEKERLSTIKYANEGLIVKLLSVVDNLERALDKGNSEDAFCQGIKMIYDEMMKILTDAGLSEVEADGVFDPNLHHAVFAEEKEGVEPDRILEILQKGYCLHERVIRPAMVKVSK